MAKPPEYDEYGRLVVRNKGSAGFAALLAVCVFFGFGTVWFLSGGGLPNPGLGSLSGLLRTMSGGPQFVAVGDAPSAPMTAEEMVVCENAAESAKDIESDRVDALNANFPIGFPPLSEPLAKSAGRIGCYANLRPARMCAPDERRKMAQLIVLYLQERAGLISRSGIFFRQSGSVMAGLGDPQQRFDMMMETIGSVDAKFKAIVRKLVSQGLVDADYLISVSGNTLDAELVAKLIGSVTTTQPVCEAV